MNKPFSKILQNIDRNKTVKSDEVLMKGETNSFWEKKTCMQYNLV